MLTGSLFPTSGQIQILGLEIPNKRRIASNRIGVAPQEYALYNDLTVEQNIRFFAKLYSMDHSSIQKRLDELLPILRLNERRKTTISNLSGGMKRRVSIACALIHQPAIAFFDEATVGIDPVLRAFFWEYFRSLAEAGLTIILTSHVMARAHPCGNWFGAYPTGSHRFHYNLGKRNNIRGYVKIICYSSFCL
jgi:ABC-2 type transport system ATP-binding protein